MLTRPQYLSILLRPPFADHDISSKVATIEPKITGSHDFMWPEQFAGMLKDPDLAGVYIWSKSEGSFVPWQKPEGFPSYDWKYSLPAAGKVQAYPGDTIRSLALDWHRGSDSLPVIEQYGDFMRVHPGEKGVDIFFPDVNLNPLTANLVVADLVLRLNSGCNQCLGGKTKLIWESGYGKPEYAADNLNRADLPLSLRGHYALWLGRFRRWTLDGKIVKLGLHFEPGQYVADLKGIKVIPQALYVPQIAPVENASGKNASGLQKMAIDYDAATIANGRLVEIFFTNSGITFDADSQAGIAQMNVPASAILSILNESKLKGQVPVPDDVLNSPGLHQARIQVLDQYDLPVGYPSEPVTLSIPAR